MRRLKVLLSAYACAPGTGSEPGVGWNVACELAKGHEVWVITRANNRPAIDAALKQARGPVPHFVYFDLPAWARWWKRGPRGVHLYYYLWQLGAFFLARRLHRECRFDVVHHVTFVKYWAPSFLAWLPAPFVWGPVGGGESVPRPLWRSLGVAASVYETVRTLARWAAERDPFVRQTARRSVLALATTEQTARRLHRLGARTVAVLGESGLSRSEYLAFSPGPVDPGAGIRFVSIGRLVHVKGYHLSLQAFGRARISGAHYLLIGDGPERRRLEGMARHLGIAQQVQFLGQLPRPQALDILKQTDIFIHPSLHDSGGWACLEAMAAGKPVICLDTGGPATQVTADTGIKIRPDTPARVVRRLAAAMRLLGSDARLRATLGRQARRRISERYLWETKYHVLTTVYREVVERARPGMPKASPLVASP